MSDSGDQQRRAPLALWFLGAAAQGGMLDVVVLPIILGLLLAFLGWLVYCLGPWRRPPPRLLIRRRGVPFDRLLEPKVRVADRGVMRMPEALRVHLRWP
jgi:hypothetical protein